MSRTALTALSLSYDSSVAEGAGATPDATNGNIVAAPGPFHALIIVNNGDSSSHSLIVRGGGYTGAASGAANSAIPAAGVWPLSQAYVGDLSVAVAGSATRLIQIETTDRFIQSDGSIWLDWTASTDMTVWFVTLPYNAI
jgi:hypothetical protein